MKKKPLTVAEYLCHLGRAVVCANMQTAREAKTFLEEGVLDTDVGIGERLLKVETASLYPPGWIGLDEMGIECESAVSVARDDAGEPIGLEMTMSRGLFRRGMHVKFKAKFNRHGTVEAMEILRDTANRDLRDQTEKGITDG